MKRVLICIIGIFTVTTVLGKPEQNERRYVR